MRLLVIADDFPMPDRNSASFRCSELLSMVAETHEVLFHALAEKRQIEAIGSEHVTQYRNALRTRGVSIVDGGISRALRSPTYAAIVFEWYFTATNLIEEVRLLQPRARVVVDSVDVVFNRFEAQARVTKSSDDMARAAATKTSELAAYERADVVITVSDADAAILHAQNPSLATFTIPNIHPVRAPIQISEKPGKQLVFVGSFAHEPNVDAMMYFCREILPRIVADEPEVKLQIIGSWPTTEISRLASDHVEVLGFVPDIEARFERCAVSIAPLRFGGGMKGKIGQAMSYALPVVTTSVGAEGFGLEHGRDALIADNPADFAAAVVRLLRDKAYMERLRMAGQRFIEQNYSNRAVTGQVHRLLNQLEDYPVKRIPAAAYFGRRLKDSWERHVAWRLK